MQANWEREMSEVIRSRIKQQESLSNWEHFEENLVKNISVQGMKNQQIQLDLLSEDQLPTEILTYALGRKKEQENQQKNSKTQTYNNVTWDNNNVNFKGKNRAGILPTPPIGQIQECRPCGDKF